jgi:MoxR-like ATPase
MMDEYAPALAEQVFANAKDRIEQEYGKLQKKIEFQLPEREGELDEVTHEEFETVLSFVMANEPVMLVGSAGTGKNVICKQVAKLMNLDFYFSNAVTQEYKLTGFIDAHGVYQETEFYKAFKHGGLFMLDEIDASIPEVLVILNAAIANRYFDFPNGKIEAHENFRVVAAGNTYGLGASYQYVGRNQLDAASLDRFAQVEIEYSPAIENSLTTDAELLNFIRAFRKECAAAGINHIVSYRTITRLDKMANVMPVEKALKTCLIKNMEQDDLRMISRKIGSNCGRWKEGLEKCVE